MNQMASLPIEKQFARMGLATASTNLPDPLLDYETSPGSLRKLGPSVAPKPKNKAQPQVPVVPKSSNISMCLEPSFSTLLKTHNADGSQSSTYENVDPYSTGTGEPIYGNIGPGSPSEAAYFPPPPPPPAFAASCDISNDDDLLPLPPPPLASDLSCAYVSYSSGVDHLHGFPSPPSAEEMTSPPSPVSSSYSELRRADCESTTGSNSHYAPLSQVS